MNVGALRLATPIIAASGTFGYGVEFAHLVNLNRLGGIVVKGISLEPMAGAPAPRLCETPSGMLNAVGLQNIGVRAFVAEKLPILRSYRTAVIANVFGCTVEEYVSVIRILEDAEGLAAYELNISCPNTAHGGIQFGSDLTVANTYQGMSVDTRTRKSRLGRITGGLSGPAIRPITLRLVYEATRAVKIQVVGFGGIERVEDVLEYLIVGATAVQVGTANFSDPAACEKIISGLEKDCHKANIHRISDLIGTMNADRD